MRGARPRTSVIFSFLDKITWRNSGSRRGGLDFFLPFFFLDSPGKTMNEIWRFLLHCLEWRILLTIIYRRKTWFSVRPFYRLLCFVCVTRSSILNSFCWCREKHGGFGVGSRKRRRFEWWNEKQNVHSWSSARLSYCEPERLALSGMGTHRYKRFSKRVSSSLTAHACSNGSWVPTNPTAGHPQSFFWVFDLTFLFRELKFYWNVNVPGVRKRFHPLIERKCGSVDVHVNGDFRL